MDGSVFRRAPCWIAFTTSTLLCLSDSLVWLRLRSVHPHAQQQSVESPPRPLVHANPSQLLLSIVCCDLAVRTACCFHGHRHFSNVVVDNHHHTAIGERPVCCLHRQRRREHPSHSHAQSAQRCHVQQRGRPSSDVSTTPNVVLSLQLRCFVRPKARSNPSWHNTPKSRLLCLSLDDVQLTPLNAFLLVAAEGHHRWQLPKQR
jgi:hypothetical protein